LGYRVQANGNDRLGVAVKQLDEPITETVTFRTKFQAVPDPKGLKKNGFLAFGDSAREADLVKCGASLQPKRASIVQGSLQEDEQERVSAKMDTLGAAGLEVTVTVDLSEQTVTYKANSVTLEAKLQSPLSAITHVGYVVQGALIDVAPIEIKRDAATIDEP
jgi:hypothetical protein